MNFEIKKNEQYNSNEIFFDGVPEKATREALKAIGFRWHNVKKCWYGYKDEATIRNAIAGKTETKKTEAVNEYGVKVGDVFKMSWGYDQTNNDFFQVVSVTAKKARVVEVVPPFETESASFMSENRKLSYKEGEKLPRSDRPLWIKDNENGDLKSIRDYGRNEHDPWIVIDSRGYGYSARRCQTGESYYESWYA